ncbi:hypothetical protein D3C76_886860 [compost metagenome]
MTSQSLRVSARPSPVPPNCRVIPASAWANGWKMRWRDSSGMPMPVSRTLMRTPPAAGSTRTSTRPARVNLRALDNRLLTTWRTRVGSPATCAGSRGLTRQVSSTPGAAFCDSRLAVSSISVPRSKGIFSSSNWPASNFDRSSTSLSSLTSTLPESWAMDSCWRCSGPSGPSRARPSMPSRPLSGVRISWLMLARKVARVCAMSSAVRRAWSRSRLDCSRRVLAAFSSAVRAATMFSSSSRYWVRRSSASRRCCISMAMRLSWWLVTSVSTPISSCSWPRGQGRALREGERGSCRLSESIRLTSGLVSRM